MAQRASGTLDVLLSPQVQKRGGIRQASHAVGTSAFGRQDPFPLQAGENSVRQTYRDLGGASDILDSPRARRLKQEDLSRYPRFPS